MPTLETDHRFGRHKRLKMRTCKECFPAGLAALAAAVGDQPLVGAVIEVEVKDEKVVAIRPTREPRKQVAAKLAEAIDEAPVAEVTQELIEQALDVKVHPTVRTREAWLLEATDAMRPWFVEADEPIGDVRVSIGWPAGRSAKKNTIGQCFQSPLVADGNPAIFISPVLTDPVEILAVLVHELVHAVVPVASNPHRGPFVKLSRKLGLVGPWTATTAGEELKPKLQELADRLGHFGHAAVSKGLGGTRKVQDTRMLKVECPDCGCIVRMTRKWLDEAGAPKCGCGEQMAEVVA